jgi:hypothetical protein
VGIYRGWIDGLASERGISGFFRGLIVSAGGILLGLFAVAFVTVPLEGIFPPGSLPNSAIALVMKTLLRAGFLFYPAFEVSRRKGLPLPWLWGAAAFLYMFPSGLNSALVVGVVGAWTPRTATEDSAEEPASTEEE